MLNNYLVRSRLIVLALLPVVIFTITAIYSISTMGGLVKGIDSLYENRVVPLKQIKTVSDNYAVNIVDLFHKFKAGTISQNDLLAAVQQSQNTADKEWNTYLSTDLTSEEKSLVNTVEQKLKPVQAQIKNLLNKVRTGDFQSLPQQQFVTDLYNVFDPLSASYQALIELQLNEANHFKKQADENFALVSLVMKLSVALLIFLLLAIAYFIYRSIQNPLVALRDTITQIANNADLRIRANVLGEDEIADTARNFNNMLSRIHTLVTDVSGATLTLSSAAEEMNSISEQVASTATEQEQQSTMIATAITQMSSAIEQVAQNAMATSEKATNADSKAQQGQQAVADNISSIQTLSKLVNTNTQLINDLNTQTNDINQVVMMIQGVAEQTNLLALNAAIEAARAGDSGRGFAVVADEVRQLAHNTQKATASINEMISKLQGMAQQAVVAMGNAESSAQESVDHAEYSSQVLTEINQEVTEIADMNTQVSTATEEQKMVAHELSSNINEFSSSIASVSESSQQNAQASQELALLASMLQQQVNEFKV
ncbi:MULTISPECIES: methyl-accepting chemotaxis protein [Pseudoalteromonas]|uniref:methyl-accepting chemotaxis protein n=1 Tax=Pseudoalteromonas TaxID=53246 RepID=UPI00160080D2|nr:MULTISPECIES: methyl-accepting chemotaxis protein [Pseudoalteromonas]MBB1300273.1 methyl-accepting chemotaxis protein [Pseudoalteromonas sp. SR44-8]MBB1396264.1 methyl-accepting chemotaxis protein [Pseudoalteromonas sp. SG44-8]MBB1408017.1 methyl-accepting chemotaxis protein [Pseudoalteromonas sp. SG44-17]